MESQTTVSLFLNQNLKQAQLSSHLADIATLASMQSSVIMAMSSDWCIWTNCMSYSISRIV